MSVDIEEMSKEIDHLNQVISRQGKRMTELEIELGHVADMGCQESIAKNKQILELQQLVRLQRTALLLIHSHSDKLPNVQMLAWNALYPDCKIGETL